jgi:hypothetical protein
MGTPQSPAIVVPMPAVDSATEGISRASIQRLIAIVAAGAIGGFLFWIIAKLTGTSPLSVNIGFWEIPALMFLGAFSAAIGVYVLTASDTAAIKTYIFASLCGLCWQPVIASGIRMVSNATATSQTEQLGTQGELIQQATNSGSVEQLNAAVQQTPALVTQALDTTATTDSAKRSEVLDTSKRTITQLQSAAEKAPDATIEALQNISVSAANSGTPSVALHSVQSLLSIGLRANRAQNTAVVENVRQSLGYIAAHSKDVSIQTAAKNSATLLSQ